MAQNNQFLLPHILALHSAIKAIDLSHPKKLVIGSRHPTPAFVEQALECADFWCVRDQFLPWEWAKWRNAESVTALTMEIGLARGCEVRRS